MRIWVYVQARPKHSLCACVHGRMLRLFQARTADSGQACHVAANETRTPVAVLFHRLTSLSLLQTIITSLIIFSTLPVLVHRTIRHSRSQIFSTHDFDHLPLILSRVGVDSISSNTTTTNSPQNLSFSQPNLALAPSPSHSDVRRIHILAPANSNDHYLTEIALPSHISDVDLAVDRH
jgi:hypothetical protein